MPTISFKDFQTYDIRIGKILSVKSGKAEIDIGKIVIAEEVSEKYIGKKVIVFVKGDFCKILTVNGTPLTIDKDIKEGAKVR